MDKISPNWGTSPTHPFCYEPEFDEQSLKGSVSGAWLRAKMTTVNERLLVRRQTWWFAIAALLWSGCAPALNPDLTIKELHHTAWGPSQGAPLGGAVALAQSNDGYLWMAGPSGLFRFDGIAFERVELPHDPKLSSLSLISAFAPRSGGLWAGFTFGGVALFKGGRWQVFSVADGVPPGSAWQFAETPDGTLWVVTGHDLARFDGTRWKAVGSQMGLPASDNPILFVDSQDTLWAGGGDSLFFLRPGEHQFRKQPVAVPTPWDGNGMAESSTGTVWLDAGFDLVPVAQNPPPGKPGRSSYGGLAFDQDGTLWDPQTGVWRIAHPEHPTMGAALRVEDIADHYTDADGLTSRAVRALLGLRRFLIDVQMSGYHLICMPGGNQFEDLELPGSEQSMRHVLRDFGCNVRLDLLFASVHIANGIQYLGANQAFQHVSLCASLQSPLREHVARVRCENDDACSGLLCPDRDDGIQPAHIRHLKIHQRHIRFELPVQLHRLVSV